MTWTLSCVQLTLRNSFHSHEYGENMGTCACATDNSTFGRGARASYQTISPRFRPVGRFCELKFRYLSSPTRREVEISRPYKADPGADEQELATPIQSLYHGIFTDFFFSTPFLL